jgi:hypothetical protein
MTDSDTSSSKQGGIVFIRGHRYYLRETIFEVRIWFVRFVQLAFYHIKIPG